eukprot:365429-Chlamydomonas_euryale.AAC.13
MYAFGGEEEASENIIAPHRLCTQTWIDAKACHAWCRHGLYDGTRSRPSCLFSGQNLPDLNRFLYHVRLLLLTRSKRQVHKPAAAEAFPTKCSKEAKCSKETKFGLRAAHSCTCALQPKLQGSVPQVFISYSVTFHMPLSQQLQHARS